jgi:hypothetical protein
VRRSALFAALAALGITLAAAAQQGPSGVVRTVDGRELRGRLEVAGDGTAVIADGQDTTRLDLAEVMSFARDGAVRRQVDAPHRVWLRSGLELPAVAIAGRSAGAGSPARFAVDLPSGLTVEVPIASVAALRHGGSGRPEPAMFASDRRDPPANGDVLFVQKDGSSHRSQVTITGLQPDKIEFLLRTSAYDFPLAGVAGVVFGRNTGFAPDRQPRPRTAVELTTGEHLEGRLLELAAVLRLRLDEGAVVDVPQAALLSLQVASDRLVWLSELTPAVEQTPAFDRVWPWTLDHSAAGPGFVLGGQPFARGVGMVPRTRLTYDLGGRFDVFEATVGIDDRGGPAAHAIFRVLVDGVVARESAPKTLGEPPEQVRVELQKCRQLALEADFGKNYDHGDFCAFADARVVQR